MLLNPKTYRTQEILGLVKQSHREIVLPIPRCLPDIEEYNKIPSHYVISAPWNSFLIHNLQTENVDL